MSSDIVVKLENVSKYYKLYDTPKDRLKEALNPFRKKYHKEFYALQNINFELKRGECLGIIGRNGMGKSTLLKLIAHIIEPSSGNIFVNGTVSALLELGTGFNPEFTGLQNIYFYGTILGFEKKQIEQKTEEIISFADIGEFINQPVKTYSSGMFVRLAFAVQTSLTPDILLVDEVLSVGDIFFQQKCHERIEDLLKKGTSIILVSHDLLTMQKYSSRTAILKNGYLQYMGDPIEAIHNYYKQQYDKSITVSTSNKSKLSTDLSLENMSYTVKMVWPSDDNFLDLSEVKYESSLVELKKIALCDEAGQSKTIFEVGDTINIYYEVLYKLTIDIPIGAVMFTNSSNIIIHGKDTLQYENDVNTDFNKFKIEHPVRFKQSFKLDMAFGVYTISIGLGYISFENYRNIGNFNFQYREKIINGIVSIPKICSIEIIPKTRGKKFTFHGLTDINGNYEIELL